MRRAELETARVPILSLPVHSFVSFAAARSPVQIGRYIREHRIHIVDTFDTPMTIRGAIGVACEGPGLPHQPASASQPQHPDVPLHSPGHRPHWWTAVVNCEAMRRHLIEDEGTPPSRIRVCYNGIDTETYFPAPAERPATLQGGATVSASSAFSRPEGLPTLIRAFAARGATSRWCVY